MYDQMQKKKKKQNAELQLQDTDKWHFETVLS